MSENACLKIAITEFKVKMAERRGFCKQSSSSGRVSMTDAQVQEAINKMKLLRLTSQ
jgi:hypothetical protein